MNPLLLISGPTASGKTSLSIELAKALDGEIVNVDSVQVYRAFDIGSAKASQEEMQGVAHHLIDTKEPGEPSNVADFVSSANEVIEKINARSKQVLLAGGTGMYVSTLMHGLANLPGGDEQVRKDLEAKDNEELYQMLLELDALSAEKLHVNDRLRIIRALEASILSTKPASDIRAEHRYQENKFFGLFLILCWERPSLYERINLRTERMLAAGLIEETKNIVEKYGRNLQALKTLGYAQALAYLDGEIAKEDVTEQIAQQTRRFAKRQMTFWRNEPEKRGWQVYPSATEADLIIGNECSEKPDKKGFKGFRVFDYSFAELLEKVSHRLESPFNNNEVWYLDAKALSS